MNHVGDLAQLLGGIGLLINSLLALAAYLQSRRNGIKSLAIEKNVATIEKATNSMKDQLVAATAKAATAEGMAAGVVEGHAAGLDQGRNEERKAPV